MNNFYENMLERFFDNALMNKDNTTIKINGKEVDLDKLINAVLSNVEEKKEPVKEEVPSKPTTWEDWLKKTPMPEPEPEPEPEVPAVEAEPEPETVTTLTSDVSKDPEKEVYYLSTYVNGGDFAVDDYTVSIPFAACHNGKSIVGIKDEQLVALLAWRYRFNDKRSKIIEELIQTYYE